MRKPEPKPGSTICLESNLINVLIRLSRLFFSFFGTIGRPQFLGGLISSLILSALAVWASLAALPWLASQLAPRGINAAFVLNGIWAAVFIFAVWSLSAVSAKRLRGVHRWPWWGALSALGFAVLILANDYLFLASRYITVPAALQNAIAAVATGVGLWVVYQGLRSPHK